MAYDKKASLLYRFVVDNAITLLREGHDANPIPRPNPTKENVNPRFSDALLQQLENRWLAHLEKADTVEDINRWTVDPDSARPHFLSATGIKQSPGYGDTIHRDREYIKEDVHDIKRLDSNSSRTGDGDFDFRYFVTNFDEQYKNLCADSSGSPKAKHPCVDAGNNFTSKLPFLISGSQYFGPYSEVLEDPDALDRVIDADVVAVTKNSDRVSKVSTSETPLDLQTQATDHDVDEDDNDSNYTKNVHIVQLDGIDDDDDDDNKNDNAITVAKDDTSSVDSDLEDFVIKQLQEKKKTRIKIAPNDTIDSQECATQVEWPNIEFFDQNFIVGTHKGPMRRTRKRKGKIKFSLTYDSCVLRLNKRDMFLTDLHVNLTEEF